MSNALDVWFIRFPDGRVLRAASTAVVRQQLGAGRIPAASTVRRGPDEEWVALGWTEEFADLVGPAPAINGGHAASATPAARKPPPPSGEHARLSSRLDPAQLQTVGVGGFAQELVSALDSTLVRRKLSYAVLGALLLGLLVALTPLRLSEFGRPGTELVWALTGAAVLLVGTLVTALLSRMTFVELSRLRPARWREVSDGFPLLAARTAVALLLVDGAALVVLALLLRLPSLVLPPGGEMTDARQWGAAAAVAAGVLAEVALWPVFTASLLLCAVLAVEGVPVATGVVQWFRLIRANLGRVFLYEALAAGVGLVATLPLFLPLLTFAGSFEDRRFDGAVTVARTVFIALALTPLFAYLIVANVFIYLNLRYETPKR